DMTLVRLLFIRSGVEAGIDGLPGVIGAALTLADAVTLVGRAAGVVGGVAVDEVVVEVLFAGQVGAPGSDAHGAVIQRAEHPGTAWVAGGAHTRITGQRAAEKHGRHGGDAPVVARACYPPPLAVGLPADFQHADTMGGLFLAHLRQRALAPTIG